MHAYVHKYRNTYMQLYYIMHPFAWADQKESTCLLLNPQ